MEKIKSNIIFTVFLVIVGISGIIAMYKYRQTIINAHSFAIYSEVLPALNNDLTLPLSNYTKDNIKGFLPSSKEIISVWCEQHNISEKTFCANCAKLFLLNKSLHFICDNCYISNSVEDLTDLGRRLPEKPVILAITIKANSAEAKTLLVSTKYHKKIISYPLIYDIP